MSETFFEVGCRRCSKGGNWKIFFDGKDKFEAKHECGHISNFQFIKSKPDNKAIDMRMFV